MELYPSLKEENKLHPPQVFSQIRMWFVLKATIDTTTTQDHCVTYCTSNHRLAIELDSGRLILSLEIIDYATFVLTM